MRLKTFITISVLFLAFSDTGFAQTADVAVAPFKSFYAYTKRNIIGAAEKMPAEHFSFKPTKDVRSFAEVIGHIVNTNYFACAALRGEEIPNKEDFEKTLKTKEDVIKATKASFDYCDVAVKNLTDATLRETFKSGTREVPKSSPALLLIAHSQEHYGNLATYLRLKGIVPPSSESEPAKK